MPTGAPVLSNPDISVEGDISLGAATRLFRDGVIFLQAGVSNLGLGDQALAENTAGGTDLTAVGGQALSQNTTGDWNTAVGSGALQINTEGEKNTAVGAQALQMNSSGTGPFVAYRGVNNTAVGFGALRSNTGGQFNTAVGAESLAGGEQASSNVAVGYLALPVNEANGNTALGAYALLNNITGWNNIAIGLDAGYLLQDTSDPTPKERDHNIFIGSGGQVDDNRTIRIGDGRQTRTFISGIQEQSLPAGTPMRTVCVLDDDQLVLCQSTAVMPGQVAGLEAGESRAQHDQLIPLLLGEVRRLHRRVAEQERRLQELVDR